MNIKELFPLIHINMESKKAVLNELAINLFANNLETEEIIKNIDLNKKVDFCYIENQLFVVNIIKGNKDVYLLFSEVENNDVEFHSLTNKEAGIELYQKVVLREFLEKFLALKKRYGGFNVKFLYLRIEFILEISLKLKREFLEKISKYTVDVTRSSDLVGQINENSFGIILTNATADGANVVVNKILDFISEINKKNPDIFIELYGSLAHELFIAKNNDFDEFIKILEDKSEIITADMKLKELIN